MAGKPVTVDLGTGDGAWPTRQARAHPERFYLGLDASAAGLAEASRRAAAKPSRGGLPNLAFGCAAAEALPPTLDALAEELTVLLPWGSLLRGVADGAPALLAGLRRVCRPGAALRVVVGYGPADAAVAGGLPALEAGLQAHLEPRYAAAGFLALAATPLDRAGVRALGTTWAGRLAFGAERRFVELRARAG